MLRTRTLALSTGARPPAWAESPPGLKGEECAGLRFIYTVHLLDNRACAVSNDAACLKRTAATKDPRVRVVALKWIGKAVCAPARSATPRNAGIVAQGPYKGQPEAVVPAQRAVSSFLLPHD